MVNTPKDWKLGDSQLPDVMVLYSLEDKVWYVETARGIEETFATKKEAEKYGKRRARNIAQRFNQVTYYESLSKKGMQKPTERKIYRPN